MPLIELETDALARLRLEARKDDGDVSACIRRLIEEANRKKQGKRITLDQLRIPERLTPEVLAASYPTAILRFMYLLGWLSKTHKGDFAMVQHYTGRGRVYFAKNAEVILESGSSTMPQRIPESEFWVVTNLSNQIKGQILDGVLTILGYSTKEIRAWVAAAVAGNSSDEDYSPDSEDDDDSDDLRI